MSALEGKGRVRSMAVRRGCVQLVFEVDEDGGGELVARLAQVWWQWEVWGASSAARLLAAGAWS
eukprot:352469-Chlamydomonas_euryale.AAC.2